MMVAEDRGKEAKYVFETRDSTEIASLMKEYQETK
jgi:hypothetical protein